MKAIKHRSLGPALLVLTSLTACSGADEPVPPPQEPGALQRSIQEPLDKARGVESQIQQQQRKLENTLNEAEG